MMYDLRATRLALVGILAALLAGCTTAPDTPPATAEQEKRPPEADPQPLQAPPQVAWVLLPQPRQMEVTGAFDHFTAELAVTPSPEASAEAGAVVEAVASFPAAYVVTRGAVAEPARPNVVIDPAAMPYPEGYDLAVTGPHGTQPPSVRVVAHDAAGVFYAAQTLKQLAAQARAHGVIPECRIVDWPDFPNRGVMIDVARDKVPAMETLYALVDMLASWKYNQLQMYTEHTFAYEGHETVWKDASPITAEDVRALDAYCRERHVQLVPNQNSFGHMHRWLQHPEYAHLAETPGGSDLCPVDPGSIELLRSMYDSMLPHFSSPYFNVGCDETWSLGKGRSKATCDAKGVGRVYLEFVKQIHGLVTGHGRTMMFWADIINNHPKLIPELPAGVVAMEWGYEAGHPYPQHTRRFRDHGVPFYVVPGTSSWNSLLGRTDNALANLREAALNGRDQGGDGYLVTDWGDGGHWQFLPVSYLPYAYGAGLSWCYDTNRDIDLVRAADAYAFNDGAGVMAQAAYDLGNAYKRTGAEFGNNTTFYMMLQRFVDRPLDRGGLERLKASDLEDTVAYIDACLARMDAAAMDRPDKDLILDEFRMNADMAKFACRLGAARVRAKGVPTAQLPKDVRATLAAELEPLLPRYRQLWLARNREGGLSDSVARLENLLTLLQQ